MVKVIAELTTNFYGNSEALYRMVAEAKRCGANTVKVQIRSVNDIYSSDVLALSASHVVHPIELEEFYRLNPNVSREITFRDYREHLEITDWETFVSICEYHNMSWGVSVLDQKSAQTVIWYKPDFIKIPSTVSGNKQLYETIFAEWDGPLIVSTGMTDMGFVNSVKRLHGGNIDRPVTIMQCTSCYPAENSDINLRVLNNFDGIGIIKGFSDHSRPGEVLAAQLAVGAGVKVIERHFRLPRVFVEKGVADTPEQFKNYVKAIRQAEIIMGSQQKTVLRCENHKYQYR